MATYTGLLVDSTYWRKNVNKMSPVARIVSLGDRIQYLDSSGNYTGAQSMAVAVIADTGGISANDIVYVSGYDSTTGYPKVKPADADTAAFRFDAAHCLKPGRNGSGPQITLRP